MQMAACVALLLIGGSYGMWQQYENATHTVWQRRRVQKRQTLRRQRHPTAT